jgi:hypothetical protein
MLQASAQTDPPAKQLPASSVTGWERRHSGGYVHGFWRLNCFLLVLG